MKPLLETEDPKSNPGIGREEKTHKQLAIC